MAVQALYRRWRPQDFDEVIGQQHITKTLRNAVAGDRLVHAYLFAGPRGTGKTSVARILAKAVNCTSEGERPCNDCAMCRAITAGRSLDLIEIDAASNTGVDDVRDLREKIGFAPNEARYKVYVIDEVHMLSRAAFNALLKTLEEPPPHALFVLATTEPHRIPDTITSRCQRHDFRRVPLPDLVGKLARICDAEGAEAEPAALELIARSATGSIRDGESLLDQVLAAGNTVSLSAVQELLGTPADDAVAGVVEAVLDADAARGLRVLNATVDQGTDPRQLRSRLLSYLRALLLLQTGIDTDLLKVGESDLAQMRTQAERITTLELTEAIRRVNDARPSADFTQPALGLELAIVETILAREGRGTEPSVGRTDSAGEPMSLRESAPTPPASTIDERSEPAKKPADAPASAPAPTPAKEKPAAAATPGPTESEDEEAPAPREPAAPAGQQTGQESPAQTRAAALSAVKEKWPAIMDAVARRDKNTAALLKDCHPVAADAESVTLGFYYEFHHRRVTEPERHALVAAALTEVLGGERELRCKVVAQSKSESAGKPRSKADQASADPVVRHAIDELGARVTGVQPEPDDD